MLPIGLLAAGVACRCHGLVLVGLSLARFVVGKVCRVVDWFVGGWFCRQGLLLVGLLGWFVVGTVCCVAHWFAVCWCRWQVCCVADLVVGTVCCWSVCCLLVLLCC